MLPIPVCPERRIALVAASLLVVAFFALSLHAAQAPQAPTNQPAPPPGPAPQASPSIAAPPPGAPTLKVTTREVLLDVLATDKTGRPVAGLKAANFSLSEEGEPQVIRRVDEHHALSASDLDKLAATPALPPNTFTNYTPVRNTNASIVLLLDSMDSPPSAQMEMRAQLINYLKHMQPGPPVAIFQLDTEMRLIQGFTSDPKVLLAAAESKRDSVSMTQPTAAPRSYGGDSQYRRALMENLRAGMRMLGSYLSGFPGRKNLIWFTGQVPMTVMGMGFGNPFRDGLTVRSTGDDLTDLTDVLTVSRIAVYPVDTRGLGLAPEIMGGRRGGINPGSPFVSHENMDRVAAQTGGKAYYDTNDFTRVITDVVNSTSTYYTIAYSTTNTKWNGELRHVKVTVDQPEVQLQHKQGYFAYSLDKREERGIENLEKRRAEQAAQQQSASQPQNAGSQLAGDAQNPAPPSGSNAQSAAQPPAAAPDANQSAADEALGAEVHHSSSGGFSAALALGAVPPTEIVFAARIEADPGAEKLGKDEPLPPDNFLKPEWQHKPFRNYTILFEADAHRISLTQTPDGIRHGTVDFVAVVYTGDGQVVNDLQRKAAFDLTPDKYHEILVSGLHLKQQIAIPVKGNFFLRLGIHDENGDQVGALEIPIDQIALNPASGQHGQ
jgi:VWFA-related protein